MQPHACHHELLAREKQPSLMRQAGRLFARAASISNANSHSRTLQLYRSARFGKCVIAGKFWTYAGALFDVMHHVIARSRNSMRILYMQDELTGNRNLAPLNPRSIPRGFFHTWSVDARHDAIYAFANLMRNWPCTFITKGIQYGMTSYDARGDETRLPLWFDRILIDNFYRKWCNATGTELRSNPSPRNSTVNRSLQGFDRPECVLKNPKAASPRNGRRAASMGHILPPLSLLRSMIHPHSEWATHPRLSMIPAEHGDCIVLSYGPTNSQRCN